MSLSPQVLSLAVWTVLGTSFASAPAVAAPCPTSSWGMGDESGDVTASSFDQTISDLHGSGRLYYEDSGDSLSMTVGTGVMHGAFSRLIVRQTYVLVGASPATPISFRIRWPGAATILGNPCYNSYLFAQLYYQGGLVAPGYFLPQQHEDGYCVPSHFPFHLDLPITRGPGDPFIIEQDVGASLNGSVEATVKAALRFEGLPPGVAVVSCFGDTVAAGPPDLVGVGPAGPLALGIDAVPNPSRGAIRLALSIPRGGPAVLRLLDVAGRVVATRIWDAPAPSRRDVVLEESHPPGTYFARVSQGIHTATRAVTVLP